MNDLNQLAAVLRGGRQCDEDGTEIIMSREACCVAADELERKDAAIAELVMALKSAGHTFVYGDKIDTIKIIESAIAKHEPKQEGK